MGKWKAMTNTASNEEYVFTFELMAYGDGLGSEWRFGLWSSQSQQVVWEGGLDELIKRLTNAVL